MGLGPASRGRHRGLTTWTKPLLLQIGMILGINISVVQFTARYGNFALMLFQFLY